MKELKINEVFERISPKKKPDEMEQLIKSLQEKGYVGSPIMTWRGFIVDGHNRYRVCKEYGITISPENIEEIDLGEEAEEIDALDWMVTHHLSSKSLTPGEKLAMTEKFQEQVRLDNAKKIKEGGKLGAEITNSKTGCLQLEAGRDRSLNTETQVAKKTGLGRGTVARYNSVMKNGSEELKEEVRTGIKSVNKGYEEVKKQRLEHGISEEQLKQEAAVPPEKQIIGSYSPDDDSYQACIFAKTTKGKTISGIAESIKMNTESYLNELKTIIVPGLFSDYKFEGMDGETTFVNLATKEEKEAVVTALNKVTNSINNIISKIMEENK